MAVGLARLPRMAGPLMTLVTMAGCMQQDTKAIRTEAPYGAWTSPLTATRVTAGALRLGEIALDGDDVYWTEGRASEGGRYAVSYTHLTLPTKA